LTEDGFRSIIGVVNINSEVFPERFFRHSLSQSNHSIFCIIDTPSEVFSEVFSDIKARFELDKIKGKNFLLILRLSRSIKKNSIQLLDAIHVPRSFRVVQDSLAALLFLYTWQHCDELNNAIPGGAPNDHRRHQLMCYLNENH
jgi:hypothetical protein